MRILVVCTRREYAPFTNYMAPFVFEQIQEIRRHGVKVEVFFVEGGIRGYVRAIKGIRKAIEVYHPDVVHAHYGLCGIVANIQRKVPVVTTYHGSDLNIRSLAILSNFAIILSKANIVVSEKLKKRILCKNNVHVIPCGIDTNLFEPMSRDLARNKLGWKNEGKCVLFSKMFSSPEKNYPLAKAALEVYNSNNNEEMQAELLEFKGYSREQVPWVYNAVDCAIMTSHIEGSPQFIKEAMACNCPIVSVDVGDVKEIISGTSGCFLAERNPMDLADKLKKAIVFGKTLGRERVVEKYDAEVIANRIIEVYKAITNRYE